MRYQCQTSQLQCLLLNFSNARVFILITSKQFICNQFSNQANKMIGKSSYEGYRNLRDPDDVFLSNVITSSIPPDGPMDISRQLFKQDYKLLDNVVSEEINPLPLPVEKYHHNAYIHERFKSRHISTKNRLVIEGKVRVANTQGKQGAPVMIPSQEGLEDWKTQSVQFGLHLKQLKETQIRGLRANNPQTEGQTPSQRKEQDNDIGYPKIEVEKHLKVQTHYASEQGFQASNQAQLCGGGAYGNIFKIQDHKKITQPIQPLKKQKVQRLSQSNDTLQLTQHNLSGAPSLSNQRTSTVEDSSAKSATSVQVDAKNRRRDPNQNPWNKNSIKEDYALTFIKQNQQYAFDSINGQENRHGAALQEIIAKNKQQLLQSTEDLNKSSSEEDSKPYQEIIPLAIRKLLKRVSTKFQEERTRQRDALAGSDKQQYVVEPGYRNDLRRIFQTEMRKMDSSGLPKLNFSEKRWEEMIKVQDDWSRVEEIANDALKQACAGLNPKFQIGKRILQRRYVGSTAHSSQRVKHVKDLGAATRVANLREELGILAYMRQQGIENQSRDAAVLIREFSEQTRFHPRLAPYPLLEAAEKQEQPSTLQKVVDEVKPVIVVQTDIDNLSERQLQRVVTQPPSNSQTQQAEIQPPQSQLSQMVVNGQIFKTESSRNVPSGDLVQAPDSLQQRALSPEQFIEKATANTYLSSDFWFHKGVVLNQKEQNESAVECYTQALKINEKHLPSIFNLACNLEKLKRYEKAKHWFEHAIKVKPSWPDALYGLTLVCIKLKQPKEAIVYINRALDIEKDQAQPHIKYAVALAYRADGDWQRANDAYVPIMKNERTITSYRELIEKRNQTLAEGNLSGELNCQNFEVDLYSHFKEHNWCKPVTPYVDLFPYYDVREGWLHDKKAHVVNLLQKIRFFNRFDEDALKMMLTKVTLKRLKTNSVLFFQEAEAAIIVSGNLHLLSHEQDLQNPYIAATYNPGDVIGIDNDNGWYGGQHNWLCAWEDVDVFLISDTYIKYMWDSMKKFSANLVADMLDKMPQLQELSEQTLFTIAHDIAKFKEYRDGEVIVYQDHQSEYNLLLHLQEAEAVKKFSTEDDAEITEIQRKHEQDLNPKMSRIWHNQEVKNSFFNNRAEHKIAEKKARLRILAHSLDPELAKFEMQEGSMGRLPFSEEFKADMKRLKEMDKVSREESLRALQLLLHSKDKLDHYRQSKETIKPDADGIYILVKGEAKVVNSFEQDFQLARLEPGEYFGGTKYLKEQRYSYFGDVIACAGGSIGYEKKHTKDNKIEKRKTLTKPQNHDSSTNSCQRVTTCMFLAQELLYLIPFYDLQRLRKLNESDKKVNQLRKTCMKEYRDKIRNQRRSFK